MDKIIEQLNASFAINSETTCINFINGPGQIPQIQVKNDQAHALISLQGAHMLEWHPHGQGEILWLSDEARFLPGKSVRGGVPICWPWFGAHDTHADYPAHGFARTVNWRIVATTEISADQTELVFELDTADQKDEHRIMWPWPTNARYRMLIGKDLTLELTTTNNSDRALVIGQALHTYFYVADVTATRVTGLEGKDYLDKTDGFKRKTQQSPLTIEGEVDRIYLDTPDEVVIHTKQRNIHIDKQGSRSTVVWNPGQAVAEKMGDLGQNGYLKMLCVESANAAEDTVQIEPGEQHTLTVTYRAN